MIGAGIFPVTLAVVDRSKTARNRVVAILDGEFTAKRYRKSGNQQ